MQGLRKTPRNWKNGGGICAVVVTGSGVYLQTAVFCSVTINGEEITGEGIYEVAKGTAITCVAEGAYSSSSNKRLGAIAVNGKTVVSAYDKVKYQYTVTGTTHIKLTASSVVGANVEITTA